MKDSRPPIVRSLVLVIVVCALLLTCLKIISYGYLPSDDALRHAAKVVSGKSWQEIVVLRPDMITDRHEGWHVFLGAVHRLTGCQQEGLVVVSVVLMALVFLLAPLPWLRRPEVWPLVLVYAAVAASPSVIGRIFLGRPFVFTMAVLMTLLLVWPRLKSRRLPIPELSLLLFLLTISTWFNGIPHLFVLPLIAFALAREWLVLVRSAVVMALGAAIGASLTGSPLRFIVEGLLLSSRAFADAPLQNMVVAEFQAYGGEGAFLLAILFLLLWRSVRGEWSREALLRDPVFLLMGLGWVLGFSVMRFWTDWGLVAALAWLARELNDVAERRVPALTNQRLALALAGGLVFYLNFSSDLEGRWTKPLTRRYLSQADPVQKDWLPDPGGIVYSDVNQVFYDTFYSNPRGEWRYLVGFEPTLMPPEDLKILRRIQWNPGAYSALQPWVEKMRPADRLMLFNSGGAPQIAGLEWASFTRDLWIGRLPRTTQVKAPAAGK
ncbi:MAG: hypothetical protein ACE15E_12500 [Acidobacteriota bacterium]